MQLLQVQRIGERGGSEAAVSAKTTRWQDPKKQ